MDRRIYFGSGFLLLALALTISVAGWPVGLPVKLLTGTREPGECLAANTTGLLIVDPKAGTAIVQEDMAEQTAPVSWPAGFTGRKSWSQVEVLDTAGHVVARTGQRYELLGGYNVDGTWAACVDGVYPPLWPSPR